MIVIVEIAARESHSKVAPREPTPRSFSIDKIGEKEAVEFQLASSLISNRRCRSGAPERKTLIIPCEMATIISCYGIIIHTLGHEIVKGLF